MTRISLPLALIATLVGATVVGCAEQTPEIYIERNELYSDSCELPSAGGAGAYRGRGVLDLFIARSYNMLPSASNTLVESNTVTYGSAGGQGLNGNEWEASTISLTRAVVEYDVPNALGVPLPNRLEIPISGTMQPEDSAIIELQVITPSIGQTLATSQLLRQSGTSITMKLRLKFFGTTIAGREVDSNEFVYPVDLCFGCLLEIPPAAIDATHPVQPNCRNSEFEDATATTGEETLCFTGQDVPVDCRHVCPIINATPNADPEGICEPQL